MTFLDYFAVWYMSGLFALTYWLLKTFWVDEPLDVPVWGLLAVLFAVFLGPLMFPLGYFGYKIIRKEAGAMLQ